MMMMSDRPNDNDNDNRESTIANWRAEGVRMVRRPRASSLEGASNDPVFLMDELKKFSGETGKFVGKLLKKWSSEIFEDYYNREIVLKKFRNLSENVDFLQDKKNWDLSFPGHPRTSLTLGIHCKNLCTLHATAIAEVRHHPPLTEICPLK